MVMATSERSNDLLDEWNGIVDAMDSELVEAILEQGIYQHKDNEVLKRMRKVLEERIERIMKAK